MPAGAGGGAGGTHRPWRLPGRAAGTAPPLGRPTLITLARSTVIDAPLAAVWRLLRDFNGHEAWHPAIAGSAIEQGEPADLVAAVRAFRLTDGGLLREQLLGLSDHDHSLTYCLLEAPFPLHRYVATLRLRRITDGNRTLVQWHSRFAPPPEQAAALTRLVGEQIYDAGLAALRHRFNAAQT